MTPNPPNTRRPPPLAATAIIGLGTLVSLGMSVIANKVYALTLGPSGVGVIALLLSAITVGALAAGLGLGTSVVQLVSAALASGDARRSGVMEQVARRLTLGVATVLALIVVLFREEVATWVFGTPSASPYVLFVGPAIVLTALAYLETGILTGHQRIRTIALANVFAAVIGMVVGVAAVMTLGLPGFAPAILVSAAAHFLFVRRRTHAFARASHATQIEGREAATRLIRLGAPACVSQLAAVGAQLVISVVILHALGEHEVGLYRAASMISIAYLTLFLSTLSYEFLPRIARLRPDELGAAVDRHMRLLLGIGLPLILALFALGPYVLELLFSEAFVPAMSVLQWQLVGDLLRLPAWALAFALIARSRGGMFLGLEALTGAALMVAVPLGVHFAGIEGVGMGYAVAQAVYLVVAWAITSRLGVTSPGRLQAVVVVIAVIASTSIILGIPLLIRGVLFGALAIILAVLASSRLYALHRAGEL